MSEAGDIAAGLGALALARGEVDRATDRRGDTEWVAAAWADEGNRVLVLHGRKALARFGATGAELVLVPPGQAPQGLRFLLGVDSGGAVYFGVAGADHRAGDAADRARTAGPAADQAPAARQDPEQAGVREVDLREAGPLLSDRDAGLLTHAVALANWHGSHTHCPRCGTLTESLPAGHARRCPADGSEHFPRIDPAVIMLVTDADDRCLLARNRRWPQRRVSILAGFVEPGESAEQAVVREVGEETAVVVGQVRYVASQPWPMPQSLMLGFRARAEGRQQIRVDDEEIAEARWFSREDLRAAMATGEVMLPPPVSIAHRIIESWYGEPLTGAW